jgi:hypothetical protein
MTKLQEPHRSVSPSSFENRVGAHENEPGHPFVRHALRQEVCHEDIQQQLPKRVKHVEHAEEVKQRDGDAKGMFESDRWHPNEYASEWI